MYSTLSYTNAVSDTALFAGILAVISTYFIVWLFLIVLSIVAMWKVFKKAGREGWEAIIPIYNFYVLFEISGLKGWYVFLGLIPFVGWAIALVCTIKAYINLAKSFGKSSSFAIGLFFLNFIFMMILGFGQAEYHKLEGEK